MASLLINLLIALLIAGVAIWIVKVLTPHLGLPPIIVTVVQVVIVVLLVIWLLRLLLASDFALTLPR